MREYVIARGDTLRGIARAAGLSALCVMEENPYLDPTALRAGMRLSLPDDPRVRVCALRYRDTTLALLSRHNVSLAHFLRANPDWYARPRYPGRRYRIPGAKAL